MTEEKAITELITGNEKAYNMLFFKYTDSVFGFICNYISDREVAKELTQDVFLKLWVVRREVDPGLSFQGFLFTIARHHLYNYLKRQLKEKSILKSIHGSIPESDPHNDYDYRETSRIYRSLLEVLPTRQKKIYLLNRESGFTYGQIAAQMNLSVSTVEKDIAAASHFLKTRFKDYFTLVILYLLSSF